MRHSAMAGEILLNGHRSGVASLEVVLVLPILLLLFIVLLWMGMASSQQADVSVVARYKAWDQRNAQKANPFDFKDAEQGEVAGSAKSPVKLSPIMDDWASPQSKHVLLAGAWQSPHVDLNESPNWNRYNELAGKGASQKLNEVDNLLKEFSAKIGEAISTQVQSQVDALNPFKELLDDRGEEANGQIEQKKSEENQKAKAALEEQQSSVRLRREKAEADQASLEKKLSNSKSVERPRIMSLIEKEKKKTAPDDKELKRLEKELENLEKRIVELEETEIPKLKKGIESLKKAEGDLQKSLDRVN